MRARRWDPLSLTLSLTLSLSPLSLSLSLKPAFAVCHTRLVFTGPLTHALFLGRPSAWRNSCIQSERMLSTARPCRRTYCNAPVDLYTARIRGVPCSYHPLDTRAVRLLYRRHIMSRCYSFPYEHICVRRANVVLMSEHSCPRRA